MAPYANSTAELARICQKMYIADYINALAHDFHSYVSNGDATCTENGTETATCSREGCNATDTRTQENSSFNHEYGAVTYAWNENQCTASRVCLNDNTHVESETVIAKYVKDTDATCTTRETGHYQATFENEVFGAQETARGTVENGNLLNHSFTNYVSDKNATYDEDGTKTAVCDYACGETDTQPELGSKLKDNRITFNTLSVGGWMGLTVSGKVSHSTAQFSFENEISVSGSATYALYKDNDHSLPLENKTVDLALGDNTFYVLEKVEGYYEKGYMITIRRKLMYTVTYTGYNDETVATQTVEEDSTVSIPEQVPTRIGYTFDGWDYEFTEPITDNKQIFAKWSANTNTPYKIEYYL